MKIKTTFSRKIARKFPGAKDLMKTYAGIYKDKQLVSKKLGTDRASLEIGRANEAYGQIPRLYQKITPYALVQQIEFGDLENNNEAICYTFEPETGLRNIELFTTHARNIDCVFPDVDCVRATIKIQVEEKFSQNRRRLADNLYNDMLITKTQWGDGFENTIKFALQNHSDAISGLELEAIIWRQAPELNCKFTLNQYHDWQINGEKRPTFEYIIGLKNKYPRNPPALDNLEPVPLESELVELTRAYKRTLPALDQKIIDAVNTESLAEAFRVGAMGFIEDYMRQKPY